MGLADLFEFRVSEGENEEVLAGMTEEEFRKMAKSSVLKLRKFCKEVGGRFIAHDPLSATCYLPEDETVDLVKVTRVELGIERPFAVIFTKSERHPIKEIEFIPEGRVSVEIPSEALQGAELVRMDSNRGSMVKGELKAKMITVKTDPFEYYVNIELL